MVLIKKFVQLGLKLRDLGAPLVLEPSVGDLCLHFFLDLGDLNCLAILLLDLLHKLFGKLSDDNAFGAFLLFFDPPADHRDFGLPALHNVVELFLHALAPSLAILDADFKLVNAPVFIYSSISIMPDLQGIHLSLQALQGHPQIIVLGSRVRKISPQHIKRLVVLVNGLSQIRILGRVVSDEALQVLTQLSCVVIQHFELVGKFL